ncbi:MAG TPA: alpha/beta fold hydrolase [Candidatus Limnocylindrales bacterium]
MFIHGAIVISMWGPQVDRLRDRYRCVLVDLPGHGRLAGRPFTLDAAVETVRAAIDECAGGRAVLVGLSLGGYVAMAVAARHPERVRGLVVADASLEPRGLGGLGMVAYGWLLRLMPAWLVREVAAGLFRRQYGRRLARELVVGYDSRAGAAAVLRLRGERFRDRLRAYGGPVLVLNGDRDAIFTAGERRLAGNLRNVTIQRIAGASHLSSVDRPDEFTAAVATFEASLPA